MVKNSAELIQNHLDIQYKLSEAVGNWRKRRERKENTLKIIHAKKKRKLENLLVR